MNKRLFLASISISVILLLVMAVFPKEIKGFVNDSFELLTQNAGIIYILYAIVSLVFVIVVAYKYGNIVVGNTPKKYSEFTWASMMFCTGIGGSMIIFSFVEPLYYLTDAPFEIEAMSDKAYEYAHMYGQFHWGILDWILCVPLTVFLSIMFHNSGNRTLRIGKAITRNCLLCSMIDAFCVFAMIGGVSTSMGLAEPVIGSIIKVIFGIKNDLFLLIGIFVVWFAIYSISVWRGLEKGIKKLSSFNVAIAVFFIVSIFVIANPIRVIDTEINSLGLLADNFLRMTFYTDPFGSSRFPQRWTVFYWALTLAYLPGLAVFTTRISEGRTIRQIIGGMVIYGSLGTMFSFAVLGYYSLKVQRSGQLDLCAILSEQGQSGAIKSVLGTLPGAPLFLVTFAVICLIFMATTIDSTVYSIAFVTMDETAKENTPQRWLRMVWAVVMLLFAGFLARIGGLNTMQTASIITALPVVVISVVSMWKFFDLCRSKDDKSDLNNLLQ